MIGSIALAFSVGFALMTAVTVMVVAAYERRCVRLANVAEAYRRRLARMDDRRPVRLVGGPCDGQEIEAARGTRRVTVPVFDARAVTALWGSPSEGPSAPPFGRADYELPAEMHYRAEGKQ